MAEEPSLHATASQSESPTRCQLRNLSQRYRTLQSSHLCQRHHWLDQSDLLFARSAIAPTGASLPRRGRFAGAHDPCPPCIAGQDAQGSKTRLLKNPAPLVCFVLFVFSGSK